MCEGRHPGVQLRLTLLQLSITHLNSWIPSIFCVFTNFLGLHLGFHDEQLHLEEYAALRVVEAVQNQNTQLLVATTCEIRGTNPTSKTTTVDGGSQKSSSVETAKTATSRRTKRSRRRVRRPPACLWTSPISDACSLAATKWTVLPRAAGTETWTWK